MHAIHFEDAQNQIYGFAATEHVMLSSSRQEVCIQEYPQYLQFQDSDLKSS